MARAPRIRPAGGIFHITSRGNRRQEIFTDDIDREQFLAILGDVVGRYGWRCHAYCLMKNHYHLLVETPTPNLSEGMHRLNFLYAQHFNRRHGVAGHLFQGRFHSVLVQGTRHLLELSRYVVLNPVRAGLCRAARDWRWSSCPAFLGLTRPPRFLTIEFLLSQFGPDVPRARKAFGAFVLDAVLLPRPP